MESAVFDWNRSAIRFYDRLGANQDDWLHYGLKRAELQKLAGA